MTAEQANESETAEHAQQSDGARHGGESERAEPVGQSDHVSQSDPVSQSAGAGDVEHVVVPSPIGDLTVVAQDGSITHLLMDAAKYRPHDDTLGRAGDAAAEPFASAALQLREYFAGERTDFDLPLAPRGDEFHQKVWALLRAIPYGETRSYGDLARALGDRNLAQAVGTANGRNPIGVVVPCHRVIGADGSLVGYAGGLDRKRFLLALEEPPADEVGRLF